MQPYLLGEGEPMRFARLEALIGQNTMQSLTEKTVFIAGIGGVGSYALEALVRSGIGNLILADPDRVDVTNINRQIIALDSTVGKLKVDVASARVKDINPAVHLTTYPLFLDSSNLDSVLNQKIDFIVDAIDSVDAKTALIEKALEKKIPIISAMGFAKKLHPEMIQLSTLKKTSVCPLAKTMRLRLKNVENAMALPVVFSTETPLEITHPSIKLGSVSTVPSSAGLMMASYIINHFITESKEEKA